MKRTFGTVGSRLACGLLLGLGVLLLSGCSAPQISSAAETPVKLIFIHHSCGENWLSDENGGLGAALGRAGYFVSDTNYGWGPETVGDRTDIPDWPEWFCGEHSARILAALFRESATHSPYARSVRDPGGENRVILFKSCFPNSQLEGKPDDPPGLEPELSVAGAKAVYIQLRKAFQARPDKFFMVITAPPVRERERAANARAFNTWLVKEWLKDYPGRNVAVFDFYNILTGKENHHRVRDGQVEHIVAGGGNTLVYPSDDDHPSAAGNRKATAEFVPFLDFHVRRWLATAPAAATPTAGSTREPASPVEKTTPAATAPVAPPAQPAGNPKGAGDNWAAEAGWEVFQHEGVAQPMLTISRKDIGGTSCLSVAYRVNANTWAACARVQPEPVDWQKHRGVSVRYLAPAGCKLLLIAYESGSENSLLHFECALPEGTGKWQDATVLWNRFRQPDWQGDADQAYRPERARGVAFLLHPGEEAVQGEFQVADVRVE